MELADEFERGVMAVSQYAFFSDLASLCFRSTSLLSMCKTCPPSSFFQGSLAGPVSTGTQFHSFCSWN